MHVFQFFLELGAIFFRISSEHGDGALVSAGRYLFEVNAPIFKKAMEVRNLGKNTDGSKDREWRGDDPVGDTGHEITATGGYFVHDHGQRNLLFLYADQLGRG